MPNNFGENLFSRIKPRTILLWLSVVVVLFSLGAISDYFYFNRSQFKSQVAPQEEGKDVYLGFLSEVYDTIKQNYWDNLSDGQLSSLFKTGAENLVGGSYNLKSNDLEGLKKKSRTLIPKRIYTRTLESTKTLLTAN